MWITFLPGGRDAYDHPEKPESDNPIQTVNLDHIARIEREDYEYFDIPERGVSSLIKQRYFNPMHYNGLTVTVTTADKTHHHGVRCIKDVGLSKDKAIDLAVHRWAMAELWLHFYGRDNRIGIGSITPEEADTIQQAMSEGLIRKQQYIDLRPLQKPHRLKYKREKEDLWRAMKEEKDSSIEKIRASLTEPQRPDPAGKAHAPQATYSKTLIEAINEVNPTTQKQE